MYIKKEKKALSITKTLSEFMLSALNKKEKFVRENTSLAGFFFLVSDFSFSEVSLTRLGSHDQDQTTIHITSEAHFVVLCSLNYKNILSDYKYTHISHFLILFPSLELKMVASE